MNEQEPNKTPEQVTENSPLRDNESLVGGQFLLPKAGKNEERRSIEPKIDIAPDKKFANSAVRKPAQPYSDTSSGIAGGIVIGLVILIGGGFFGCIGGQALRIFPKLPDNMLMLVMSLIFVLIPAFPVLISILAASKGSSVWSSEYLGLFALLFLLSAFLFACFVQNLFTARSL